MRAQVEPDDPPPGNSYPDVPVNFADSSCDAQKDTIVKEVSYAYQMAMHTADSVTKEGYYDVCHVPLCVLLVISAERDNRLSSIAT